MPVPYKPDAPDSQTVRLTLVDDKLRVDRWESYDFATDFLTPADSFSFRLGSMEGGLPADLRKALKIGARVQLHVESSLLAAGRIDSIEISADRGSGIGYDIHGRDNLGQTLDAIADPTFHLKNGGTLAELLKRLFAPYGWATDDKFEIDNEANRDARKGKRGIPTRNKDGTKKGRKKLTAFVLHQTKPYNHESVFHFASRVAQRHGLWIWASADGQKLIVSRPDYKQEPSFVLVRGRDGRGNILSGSVRYELTDQPTMIIADGFVQGGSGEFGKGRIKAFIVNPLLGLTDGADYTADVKALLQKHPGAVENTLPGASFAFRSAAIPFRPMFLHDDESKTQDQLNAFVKREMSLLYRKALTTQYTVEGHGQTVGGNFVAWAPDTMVDVHDELGELRERMYVLGVSYSKSRRGGTTTKLDLVRERSIDLGFDGDEE
jgi:prophage tail gpP-like protein